MKLLRLHKYLLYRIPIFKVSFGRNFIMEKKSKIEFNGRVSFGHFVFLTARKGGQISFGSNVKFNNSVHINSDLGGQIVFGDDVLVGPNCVFRTANHKFRLTKTNFVNQGHRFGDIKIGNNVWIGANCTILPGIQIGSNSVIGAGSIVNKSIPEGVLAVGNPAKIKKIIRKD